MAILDISLPLHRDLPVWPGSPGMRLTSLASLDAGDEVNVSQLEIELHTGTHVDAPRHFLADGPTVERLDLAALIGEATVAHLTETQAVTPADLESLDLPPSTRRLLLRTRNSDLWARHDRHFRPDFVALTAAAARWIAEREIRLLGVDYLSVQRFGDDPQTHRVLLAAGVVIVEGLDLSAVAPGTYELICLPLPLVGAEGAPARAILRPLERRPV